MRLLASLVAGAVALSFTASFGAELHGPFDINYRETLYFEGARAFEMSGVNEVRVTIASSFRGTGIAVRYPSLEAIPIDLGVDGMIFALNTYPYLKFGQRPLLLATACDLPEVERSGNIAEYQRFLALLLAVDHPCEVPESSWPILVRFADPRDPNTIERIFPRDLPSLTQGRVRLSRVAVEPTTDAPTTGIERYLPWVDKNMAQDGVPIVTTETDPRESPLRVFNYDLKWHWRLAG